MKDRGDDWNWCSALNRCAVVEDSSRFADGRILLYNLRIFSIASNFTRIANIVSTALALDVVSSLYYEESAIFCGYIWVSVGSL